MLTFSYLKYAKVRIMAIHLVGETIDKARSHYQAETGRLVQLMRGIYVDAGDDIDATVLRHAVRIARYLYPRAYLSAASAVLLGPTRDGRLFLSGAAHAAHAHPGAGDHPERGARRTRPSARPSSMTAWASSRVDVSSHAPALPRSLPPAQRACGLDRRDDARSDRRPPGRRVRQPEGRGRCRLGPRPRERVVPGRRAGRALPAAPAAGAAPRATKPRST